MGSWSGLRKQIRERLTESLRKRVDYHYTVYTSVDRHGWGHPRHWSFWITVDGQEILRLGCCGPVVRVEVEQDGQTVPARFGPDDALQSIRGYLQLPIDEALASSNPFIKGLALADARVGQRRLADLVPAENAHEIERLFYDLRMGKEVGRITTEKL